MNYMDEPSGTNLSLERHEDAAHSQLAEIAVRTLVAGIPYAGGPILELWNGIAQRRTQKRISVVLEEMKKQLESVEGEKVDRKFFETEEFQTLLFLLLDKLYTTHDEKKLKMFGDALANSGAAEFKKDDREAYIRVLRDLSLSDLETLNDDRLKGWTPLVNRIEYSPDVLSSLARLAASGLVIERLHSGMPSRGTTGSANLDAKPRVEDALSPRPPRRTYQLSPFGEKFLSFVSAHGNPEIQSDR